MPDTQLLGNIRYVTDTDMSMYDLGEVDGGFDGPQLESYISQYGTDGYNQLIQKLAHMTTNATNAYIKHMQIVDADIKAATEQIDGTDF